MFTLSPCTYPVSRLNPSVLCYFARRFHDTEEVFCHAAFWALIWRVRLSVGDQSLGHGNNASFQETHPCSAADARLPVQYVRKTIGSHAETTRGAPSWQGTFVKHTLSPTRLLLLVIVLQYYGLLSRGCYPFDRFGYLNCLV